MAELDLSPAFEAALRSGLAGLADSAPLPDDDHLDALEHRAAPRQAGSPQSRRPLALVAAVVLVLAGLAGALALRERDQPARFEKVGQQIDEPTTTSTTAPPIGPKLPAQFLGVTDASGSGSGYVQMDAATDLAGLTELWIAAGLDPATIPPVDFDEMTVVAITVDDVGCRTDELEFFQGPTAVRAVAIERDPCPVPLSEPGRRTYFHGLRRADVPRPFTLQVAVPGDPDSITSIPVD